MVSLNYMAVIYKQCSIGVATRFIESEWVKKENDTNIDSKLLFLSQLIALFSDSSNQFTMEKIQQQHHYKNFQKKAYELAMHQFQDACNFPDQLQLISESV